MAFDKNLDKELFSEKVEFEGTKITVSVFSYNEGIPKLQIGRENAREEGFAFAKLGRMTKEEVVAVAPLVQKALGFM